MDSRGLVFLCVCACASAPAPSAQVVARPVVREAPVVETPPAEPLDPNRIVGLGAGMDFTCVLRPTRLSCVGGMGLTLDVDADLLHVGTMTYCVARSGQREITCRGELPALYEPGDLEDNWRMECHGDQDCVDEEYEAWESQAEREGLRLATSAPIVSLSGGGELVCALESTGRISCFDLIEPDPMAEIRTVTVNGAVEIAVTEVSGCARIADGTVQCWENDLEGGDIRPARVEGVGGATRIEVTSSFACAWDREDRAECWGWNMPFDDDSIEEHTPRAVPALDGALDVSANPPDLHSFACFVASNGRVRCHGDNHYGQLGRAPTEDDRWRPGISPELPPVVRVATGTSHACAITAEGALYCWGRADGGALGWEHARTDHSPIQVSGIEADRIVAYGDRTCARTNEAWLCWGRVDYDDARPEPWEPRASTVPREAEPRHHFRRECALARGTLRCPEREDVAVRAIAGDCIITSARHLECERYDSFEELDATRDAIAIARYGMTLAVLTQGGQLRVIQRGVGDEPPQLRASFSVGRAPIRELSLGDTHVCFRRADRTVHCVEARGGGVPRRMEVPPSEQIVSAGSGHCSRSARGEVHCWGGAGPRIDTGNTGIARVDGIDRAVELAAGHQHVCARTRDGSIFCWGTDDRGQLGERPSWWIDGPVPIDLERESAARAH